MVEYRKHVGIEISKPCAFFDCPVLDFLSRSYTEVEPLDRFSRFMNVFPRKDGPFDD